MCGSPTLPASGNVRVRRESWRCGEGAAGSAVRWKRTDYCRVSMCKGNIVFLCCRVYRCGFEVLMPERTYCQTDNIRPSQYIIGFILRKFGA